MSDKDTLKKRSRAGGCLFALREAHVSTWPRTVWKGFGPGPQRRARTHAWWKAS